MWRWLLAGVLFLAAAWSANLTLFNWWAASGPPVADVKVYEVRGTVFGLATAVLFLAFVAVCAFNVRRSRRPKEG